MTGRVAAAVALAILASPAGAADAGARWEVEAGLGRETLSTDAPAWQQADLTLRRRGDDGRAGELGLRSVRRYGTRDNELAAGFVLPAGDGSFVLRGTATDAPDFLPRLGVQAEASRRLPGGWVLGVGAGRNLYAATEVPASGTSTLRLNAEWYAGAWRLAAGATRVRLDGGPSGTGLRLQADRFFGDTARIGVIVAGGDEVENAPGGALFSRVDALVLVAQWPLAPGWTLVGDLGRTRVRDLERRTDAGSTPGGPGYSRRGGRLGVRIEF